jgi:hypothetical protein
LYRGVFKNEQVTYGNPFKIKTPEDLYKFREPYLEDEDNADDPAEAEKGPEDLLEKARREYECIIEKAKSEAETIFEQAIK